MLSDVLAVYRETMHPRQPSTPLDTAAQSFVPPDPVLLAEKMEGLLSIKLSTLRELSGSMRSFARVVASTGLFAALYNTINMVFRAAEQILGRNGTSFDTLSSESHH
jgi:hypothetical protein